MDFTTFLFFLGIVNFIVAIVIIFTQTRNTITNGDDVGIRVINYADVQTSPEYAMTGLKNALNQITDKPFMDIVSLTQTWNKGFLNHWDVSFSGNRIKQLPFITQNDNYLGPDIYGGFTATQTGSANAILTNKYMTFKNKTFKWFDSTVPLTVERSLETCLLKGKEDVEAKITMHPFIFGSVPTLIVQYSFPTEKKINEDSAVENFVSAMLLVKDFIETKNVTQYIIMGDSGCLSELWNYVLVSVFGTNNYISKTAKSYFYTVKSWGLFTTDFILITKNLAPHGVNFYTIEPTYGGTNHLALVGDILKFNYGPLRKKDQDMRELLERRITEEPNFLYDDGTFDIPNLVSTKTFVRNKDVGSIAGAINTFSAIVTNVDAIAEKTDVTINWNNI